MMTRKDAIEIAVGIGQILESSDEFSDGDADLAILAVAESVADRIDGRMKGFDRDEFLRIVRIDRKSIMRNLGIEVDR